MRLRCKIFGCTYDEHCSCARCGADIYAGDFVQIPLIEPLYRIKWKWQEYRRYRYHPCEVCGKAMYFTKDYTCSPKCCDEWIPF